MTHFASDQAHCLVRCVERQSQHENVRNRIPLHSLVSNIRAYALVYPPFLSRRPYVASCVVRRLCPLSENGHNGPSFMMAWIITATIEYYHDHLPLLPSCNTIVFSWNVRGAQECLPYIMFTTDLCRLFLGILGRQVQQPG